jgi:hypothetical protein
MYSSASAHLSALHVPVSGARDAIRSLRSCARVSDALRIASALILRSLLMGTSNAEARYRAGSGPAGYQHMRW